MSSAVLCRWSHTVHSLVARETLLFSLYRELMQQGPCTTLPWKSESRATIAPLCSLASATVAHPPLGMHSQRCQALGQIWANQFLGVFIKLHFHKWIISEQKFGWITYITLFTIEWKLYKPNLYKIVIICLLQNIVEITSLFYISISALLLF